MKHIVCHVIYLEMQLLEGNMSHGRISGKSTRVITNCFQGPVAVSGFPLLCPSEWLVCLLTADFRQNCLNSTGDSVGDLHTWHVFLFSVFFVLNPILSLHFLSSTMLICSTRLGL